MSRIIRIVECRDCPSRETGGGFGKVAYIPRCKAADKELPYDIGRGHGSMIIATQTPGIPCWCPLEQSQDVNWVIPTKDLLETQPDWLYGELWIATGSSVYMAKYEWRQGRNPHCFDIEGGGTLGLHDITQIAPAIKPKVPTKESAHDPSAIRDQHPCRL